MIVGLVFVTVGAGLCTLGVWKYRRKSVVIDAPVPRETRPKSAAGSSSKEKDREMISLVLFLRSPRYLEARVLAEIVSSAWGETYSGEETGEVDASERWIVGRSPIFMVNAPEGMFLVHNFDRQYFDDMKAALKEVTELRLHKAIEDHQAWMSVDFLSPNDESAPMESAYPRITKLIAELAGPDCTALFQPETGKINVWDETLDAKLRGPNCLEMLGINSNVPVVGIRPDDPRMKAAVEEARARWPEFVEAFKKRAGGEMFSVKAPVTVGDECEFIWIEVDGLEPEYIHGKLANDPVNLGDMKIGDRVEVPLKDLNDWAFERDGGLVGLFTVKVVTDIQKERARG